MDVAYRDGQKSGPQIERNFRQVEAEVVSSSRIKTHQIWGTLIVQPTSTTPACTIMHGLLLQLLQLQL